MHECRRPTFTKAWLFVHISSCRYSKRYTFKRCKHQQFAFHHTITGVKYISLTHLQSQNWWVLVRLDYWKPLLYSSLQQYCWLLLFFAAASHYWTQWRPVIVWWKANCQKLLPTVQVDALVNCLPLHFPSFFTHGTFLEWTLFNYGWLIYCYSYFRELAWKGQQQRVVLLGQSRCDF